MKYVCLSWFRSTYASSRRNLGAGKRCVSLMALPAGNHGMNENPARASLRKHTIALS
jgi:hypothetical protein